MYISRIASGSTVIIAALLLGACFGPVPISGLVVDQNGDRLYDVKLHTTDSAKTKYVFDSYGGESSLTLPDGKFKIRCWTCSAMHLLFYKDGYHPKAIDLSFYEGGRNLTVVLQERGPPVDLDRYLAKINVGPEYDDTYMVIADNQASALTEKELVALSVTAATPFITIRPAVNEDGSLAIKNVDFMPVVDFVDLDFSGANGAVQLYEPTDMNFTYAYAEMIAAPVDGYSETVRLKNKQVGQFFFFHCVIDGHYCKGAVSVPRVWQDGDLPRVQVSIETFINREPNNRGLDDPRGYLR